jgi:hypothetical protein
MYNADPNLVFIRGLLENVGSDINPLRLIRRIKDGLEIPGLKPAIIKILQASNLQVSLLEGAGRILNGDAITLSKQLQRAQTGGFYAAGTSDETALDSNSPFLSRRQLLSAMHRLRLQAIRPRHRAPRARLPMPPHRPRPLCAPRPNGGSPATSGSRQ